MASCGYDSVCLADFRVMDCENKDFRLDELMERVTLIVNIDCKVGGNVNSECRELQDLYLRNKERGLQILAFPSDQFQIVSDQGQHLTAMDVRNDLVKRYNVTFPIMNKVNVNGESAHPLFMYLQKRLSGFPTDSIKWDFTKFLLVDGVPRKRYSPTTTVNAIEPDITDALITGGKNIK